MTTRQVCGGKIQHNEYVCKLSWFSVTFFTSYPTLGLSLLLFSFEVRVIGFCHKKSEVIVTHHTVQATFY